MLEETSGAVTPAQAQELLPLWQMLRALQESGTASEAEVEAVLDQIQGAMTSEQLATIQEMNQEDMQALMQQLKAGEQGGSGSGEEGAFVPSDVMPLDGGQAPAGMDPSGLSDLSPEDLADLTAERMNSGFGTAQTDEVIELLETRSAGL